MQARLHVWPLPHIGVAVYLPMIETHVRWLLDFRFPSVARSESSIDWFKSRY